MLLRSTGFTCGVISSNDAMLMIGTTITVPASDFASTRGMSRCRATIELYSVPWLPATNATTGPGFAPWITATGMESPESEPAGTGIVPVAVVPRCAVAVPTVKLGVSCRCASATDDTSNERAAERRMTRTMAEPCVEEPPHYPAPTRESSGQSLAPVTPLQLARFHSTEPPSIARNHVACTICSEQPAVRLPPCRRGRVRRLGACGTQRR